jgi:hypothetical protein
MSQHATKQEISTIHEYYVCKKEQSNILCFCQYQV